MKYGKAYNIWEQILAYLSDKLSNAERNAFERELERDSFAAEAQDGFSQLTYDEFINDLKEIDTRINTTSSGISAWKLVGGAAVIALVVIVSFFLFKNWSGSEKISTRHDKKEAKLRKTNEEKQLESDTTFITGNDSIKNFKDSLEFIEEGIENLPVEEEIQESEEKSEPLPTMHEEPVPSRESTVAKPENIIVKGVVLNNNRNPISGARINISGLNKYAVTDNDGNFTLSLPANETHNLTASFSGMNNFSASVSTDTSLTIYLREIQPVTEKNITEKADTTVIEQIPGSEYSDMPDSPARSKIGEKAFKSFLKTNAVLDEDSESRKINTQLSVVVSQTGAVESVIITKSGGEVVDNKAKKLIMEGPAWYPAVRNGIAVKDTVDLKIIFRR